MNSPALSVAVLAAALATVLSAACTASGDAREAALDEIDAATLKAHVAWLADDARAGRLAGEPGYDAAASYVAARFEEFGLLPAGSEGWYQPVPLARYQLVPGSPEVIVHRASGDEVLEYREHYGMSADKVRPSNRVRADVVYAGFGVHAPEFDYSDYDGIDVDGKIVALFGGAPSTLPHAERAFYASSRTKAMEAVRRGAVGTISLRSKRIQQQTPWQRYKQLTGKRPGMAWLSDEGSASGYFPELEGAITISAATAERLFADAPLSFADALEATAADQPASASLDIAVTMARQSAHDRFTSPNVVGIVRGTDPALADEVIVYSAHLDGTGRDPAPETDDDIENGMYDNAMGIAIMLETARVFAAEPPARSVMFIALTAEEFGLLGSDYFAHYPTVAADSIVANVNLDMPLFLYPVADLVAFGSEHSSLEPLVAAAADREGFGLTANPLPEESLFIRSDQYSFVKKGVPAIYLIPGFTSADPAIDGEAAFREHLQEHYHEPSDDLSRPVDWDSVLRFTRSHIRIGYGIADAPERPTWNDGDFFGERFASR